MKAKAAHVEANRKAVSNEATTTACGRIVAGAVKFVRTRTTGVEEAGYGGQERITPKVAGTVAAAAQTQIGTVLGSRHNSRVASVSSWQGSREMVALTVPWIGIDRSGACSRRGGTVVVAAVVV